MPVAPSRKPTRAREFDYRDPGPYFVTICTQHRVHRFGQITEGIMHLTDAGVMACNTWKMVPQSFPGTVLDEFVVMPNHIHALLTLRVPADHSLDGMVSLTGIVGWFKTQTTRRYIGGVKRDDWPRFDGQLWQRSFHDEIVRTERGMERLRLYIEGNPANWIEDELYDV